MLLSLNNDEAETQGFQLNIGVMLVLWALLSALGDGEFGEKKNDLSGLPKRRRSNRLFYMEKTPEGLKTVSRAEADKAKKSIPEALYAVWALNADQARSKIEKGQGEKYSDSKKANFAGQLLNCIGWQKVVDKKDKEITRCFIYAPNCKKQSCIKDTEQRKAEGWKANAPKPKKQEIQSLRKQYRIQRMIEQSEREHKDYLEGKTNQDWSLFTKESIEQYKNPKFEKVIENAWDITFVYYDKQFDKLYTSKLSGIYTSCKQYFRNTKGHLKCGKYALTCQTDPDVQCASKKAPVPWAPRPEEQEFSEQAIKSVAKMLAEEMNQTLDDSKRIMRVVQYHGGIAPYKSGFQSEEYKDIPTKYKSKEGLPIDELAQEIGMNESELVEDINKAEDARLRLPKGKRRFSIKEMLFEAEKYLAKQASEGFAGLGKHTRFFGSLLAKQKIYGENFSPRQRELFPGMRRELILEQEDVSTSSDPFESCMERKGYTLPKIRQMMDKIAGKLTPDMFGKTEKLTGGEAMFQEQVENCQGKRLFGVKFKPDMTARQIRARIYDPKKIVVGMLSKTIEGQKIAADPLPPILGWVGGKAKLADKIISIMPEHKVYIEPFLGGGSVFFKKPLADVNVINDLDKNLMNFYNGVRDGGCEKIRNCKIPKNRVEFDRAVSNKGENICSYLGVNKVAWGSDMRRESYVNRKTPRNAIKLKLGCDRYEDRLKQAKITNKDYRDVVKEYDSKDTLVYMDPPYFVIDKRLYNHNEINPEEVAKLVKSIKGKAIISYGDHPRVRKAFAGLKFHKVNTRYNLRRTQQNVSELLITNF